MVWENDGLGNRKEVSDAFEALASTFPHEAVFLVSAEFGMGKTFFVDHWSDSLRSRDIPVFVFDAWRNDYFESPLVGFVSGLLDEFSGQEKFYGAKERLKKFSLAAAPIVLKTGIKVGARILTLGATDGEAEKIKEILAEEGVKAIDDVSDELARAFTRATSQTKLHSELREQFTKMVEEVCANSKGDEFFILIDELDRCKPEFSLALLEDIKHFLGVDGAKFFIFCDEQVLEAQGAKIVGDIRSGEKYASKFYRQKLKLPIGNKVDFARRYIGEVSAARSVSSWENGGERSEHLAYCLDKVDLSLREMRKIIEYAINVCALSERANDAWPLVNACLVLRAADRTSYDGLVSSGSGKANFLSKNAPGSLGELNSTINYLLSAKAYNAWEVEGDRRRRPQVDKMVFRPLLKALGIDEYDADLTVPKKRFFDHLESFGAILP